MWRDELFERCHALLRCTKPAPSAAANYRFTLKAVAPEFAVETTCCRNALARGLGEGVEKDALP
jgi:hypothetical protein